MTTIAGIDVGGTFTDLYLSRDGTPPVVLKVQSTPQDPSVGLMQALAEAGVERLVQLEEDSHYPCSVG